MVHLYPFPYESNLSLSLLVLHNLNVICLSVVFILLTAEIPGSVDLWFGICQKFWKILSITLSNIYFALLSLLFLAFQLCMLYTFWNFSWFVSFFFLFVFYLGEFLLTYLQSYWFFISNVRSIDKPIKGIFHFY